MAVLGAALAVDQYGRPAQGVYVPGIGVTVAQGGSATLDTAQDFYYAPQVIQTRKSGNVGDAQPGANIDYVLDGVWNGATVDRVRGPNVFKDINAVAVTAGTPVGVWTPAAGKHFRLMGYHVSLSVAGAVIFKDGGNGSAVIFRTGAMPAGQGQVSPWIGNGYLGVGAAASPLQIDVSATGAVTGFVFGCEE